MLIMAQFQKHRSMIIMVGARDQEAAYLQVSKNERGEGRRQGRVCQGPTLLVTYLPSSSPNFLEIALSVLRSVKH